jgi:hypothetical protein
MTVITRYRKKAAEMDRAIILTPVLSVLVMAILTILTLTYPANARSLTNDNNTSVTHNTNCDGNTCQTLLCINDNCHSNSSQVLNSNVPCYLPCLPPQPLSKSQ